jgi:hypothetical protein
MKIKQFFESLGDRCACAALIVCGVAGFVLVVWFMLNMSVR